MSSRHKKIYEGGTPHGEVDGLLRGVEKRERKRRQQLMVDYVFVGEGPSPGPAYEYAKNHPDEKIVVIEPQPPNYELPPNMQFVNMDALVWFESRPPESVKNVRDDFAVTNVSMGAVSSNLIKQYQEHVEIYKAVLEAMRKKQPWPKGVPNFIERTERYFKSVYRVLEPGGRFILTTGTVGTSGSTSGKEIQVLTRYLTLCEFDVQQGQLSEQQVLEHESAQAKYDQLEGQKIVRLIGTKPSREVIRDEETQARRRQLFDKMKLL